MKPGIHRHITPTKYFAEPCPAPALTNSGMKFILTETMADFAFNHPALSEKSEEVAAASRAMRQGDVTHQLALGKGKGYSIGDFSDWRTKAAQEFKREAIADGFTPVTAVEFAACEAMADILRQRIQQELNDIADERKIERDGNISYETEVVFTWQEPTPYGPIWCRGMLDVWCEQLMVALDPKITKLMHARVRPQMEAMGWDRQGVFYERGLNAIFPKHAGRIRFADLMVNPKPPHVYRAMGISKAWQAAITPDIDRCIKQFSHCLYANVWPGYPKGIEILEPTSWKLKAAMEAELADEMDEE